MANSFMADLSGLAGASSITPKKTTSREGNTELNMEDFLQLMVVQLQNQTIDDTADTGEMLNQMVQMQMITALTNMTDASIMSYASSLVGKEVTIGIVNGNDIEERVLTVTGTGQSDGQQVIFCDDGNVYQLSQIMAVGRLPAVNKPEETEPDLDPGTPDVTIPETTDKTENGGTADITGGETDSTGSGDRTDDPLEGGLLDDLLKDPTAGDNSPSYEGEQGAPTDGTE